jgi:hypothetical protein
VEARERDEFLRGPPGGSRSPHRSIPSGSYSWTRWAPTPPFTRTTLGPKEEREGLLFGSSQPWQENTTLLASMSVEGMGPSVAIVGAVDTQAFEAYLEQVLVPYLRPGQVVVMDNLLSALTKARGSKS